MDSRGFIQWMIISKKSQATINRNIEYVNFFQNYLSTKKKKDIDNANLKDLEDYKDWGESIKLKRLRMFIYSLATYYKFMKKKK
jgi:hypothetical protein